VTTVPRNTITSESFVKMPGGAVKPFPKLTKLEKQELFSRMNSGLSEELSLYYSNNSGEYIKLCNRAEIC
jgi:hypothetical protein